MGWTYDPASVADLNRVRRLVGDTNEARKLLLDEEINDGITLAGGATGNLFRKAAYACDMIAAKFARDSSVSVQGVNVERETAFAHYRSEAKKFRQWATTGNKSLFIVIDPDEKDDFDKDTALIHPVISRGMHDFRKAKKNEWKSESC